MHLPDADVAVIGAGVLGLATALALAERGVPAHVYERGSPGEGQSGGESRVFRHAHDDPRLVRETRRSRDVYDDWSDRLGVRLVSEDGAVAIGPTVAARLPVLGAAGVAARPIGAAELARRVPVLARYEGPAMLDERGGSIRALAMIRALVAALGDRLVTDEVLTVRGVDGEVEVRSGAATRRYRRAVVCAGRATARLARSAGLTLPVTHGAHVRMSYRVRGPAPPVLATLQDSSGVFTASSIYAAAAEGNARFAVGVAEDSPARPDGSLVRPDGLASLAAGSVAYVRAALPGLDPDPVEVRHCWVTRLPWGDDALAVWEAGGVLFPAGNNLFKQAPGLGRSLAAALDGEPLPDVLRPEARLGAATASNGGDPAAAPGRGATRTWPADDPR